MINTDVQIFFNSICCSRRNYELFSDNPSVNVTNIVEQSSRCNFLVVVKIFKNISAGGNNVGVLEIPF